MLPEQSKIKESSEFPDENAMERCSSQDIKRDPSGAEEENKNNESSSFFETTPKLYPNGQIKKHTSGTNNFSMRVQLHELEMAIEEARLDISNHFQNMEMQVDNNYKAKVREVKTWVRGGFANIEGGKTPQNEFFIKSLIDNFEEVIRNLEYESERDVNHAMDGIRKIVVKLVNRIKQSFTPKPFMDDVKVTRKYTATYFFVVFWSLVAVIICIYPEYVHKIFETTIAYSHSTVLVLILFFILYFHSPIFK